jgi:hypothetical protein
LLVAQTRVCATNSLWLHKPLAQAKALIEALRHHEPYALSDALDDASSRGRDGWARPIDRSLSEIVSTDLRNS